MTLRTFIKMVGLVLFVSGGILCFFYLGCTIKTLLFPLTSHSSVALMLTVMALCLSLMGLITWAGWRMFRNWNESTIAEYTFIQAAITGYAFSCTLHPFFPEWSAGIGILSFLILARVLKTFLLKFLALPRPHVRQSAICA